MNKTKGQLEAEISKAIVKFQKEYTGRGPLETRTYIIDDMILVRLKGVLTKAEEKLIFLSRNSHNGRELVKKMRATLLETDRSQLYDTIFSITSKKTISMHTDISTVTGESIILFIQEKPIRFG